MASFNVSILFKTPPKIEFWQTVIDLNKMQWSIEVGKAVGYFQYFAVFVGWK